MPRGSRRPGAGAPRGNLNGVRSANHSSRASCPRMRLNNDVRGVVTYLWQKWFDCIPAMQSNPIRPNHDPIVQPALPGFDPRPETEETKNA